MRNKEQCLELLLNLFLGLSLVFFPIFGYCESSDVEISVSAQVGPEEEEVPFAPDGGGFFSPPAPAKIIFQGRASPSAHLTLFKNDAVAATFFAETSGLFKKELSGLYGGEYAFGIFAEDTEGRKSVTLSFKVTVLKRATTTVSGIFIPPTIEFFPSKVIKGENLEVFGEVFPESRVNIFISPGGTTEETISSSEGNWMLKLNTNLLEEREYDVKAKTFFGDGEQSQFSRTLSFSVLSPRCQGADLNFDGEINIVDFSILLYFWQSGSPENICADINQDGTVNLIDFSIMMYYWTG